MTREQSGCSQEGLVVSRSWRHRGMFEVYRKGGGQLPGPPQNGTVPLPGSSPPTSPHFPYSLPIGNTTPVRVWAQCGAGSALESKACGVGRDEGWGCSFLSRSWDIP